MNNVRYRVSLYDMAELSPRMTGCSCYIWLDQGASNRVIPHDKYRIKFYKKSSPVKVTYNFRLDKLIGSLKQADLKPQDFKTVKEWCEINKKELFNIYDNEDYDLQEFLGDMKKITITYLG